MRDQLIFYRYEAADDKVVIVTILADRSIPFSVLKRIMSTCTSRGYVRISLAVLQKAPETALPKI